MRTEFVCVRCKAMFMCVYVTKWKRCLLKMSVCVCVRETWREMVWELFSALGVCVSERCRFWISMLDTQWPCSPMITALWTHEWLFEAPNCTSPSFLMGGTSWNSLGKKLCEGAECIHSFLKHPVAALEQGTQPPAGAAQWQKSAPSLQG